MNWLRLLLIPLLLCLGAGLGYTLLVMPSETGELQKMVADNLALSGVSNPVTAVLLNFRGYDTFLEMVVLLIALVGVYSLEVKTSRPEPKPGPILDTFARILVPLLILVAGYLLWVGAHAPGGAFQAGSVLGAAAVVMTLIGYRVHPRFSGLPLRLLLVAGSATFLLVTLSTLISGRMMLQFPPDQAKNLILLIETMATISIGVTLASLFLGNRPAQSEED